MVREHCGCPLLSVLTVAGLFHTYGRLRVLQYVSNPVLIPDVTVLTINSEGQRLRKGYLDVDRTSNHERRQGNNHPQSLSQQVSDKPSVHLGHAGLIHPSHQPHQHRHHLHLHPSLPQQSLSDGMLGHNSTLRSFYVVDDHCCHSGLCSCGGCLDELEGNQGGGVL